MQKKFNSFVIATLILSAFLINTIDLHSKADFKGKSFTKPVINAPLYTDPINIISDTNFTDYGFPGNGTEESPYIIENFDIVTTSDCGINIEGTTKHFIIQNGYVDAYKIGIRIRDVAENTTIIRNCSSLNNAYRYSGSGIKISNSDYCRIENNTCYGNEYGIYAYESNYVIIEENKCFSNKERGIRLSNSHYLRVLNNNLTGNYDPLDATTYDNPGLDINFVFYSIFEGNYFKDNVNGIYASHLDYSNITYNQFVENIEYGIYLFRSEHNLIHHNKFISNNLDGESQAYDSNHDENNLWYDEIANEGNYWSDFKITGFSYKYEIGGRRLVDPYPLNENLEAIEHIYSNLILGIVLFTYLVLISILTYYRMRKEEIQSRIKTRRYRKKMRELKPTKKDYESLLEEEFGKGLEKLYKEGELR